MRIQIKLFLGVVGFLAILGAKMQNVAAKENSANYQAPSLPIKLGQAPGVKVQLLNEDSSHKEYAVIFSKGDEVLSGLTEFAEKYRITSAHFTAIGSFRKATLAWFSAEKKMYKKIPIQEQVEVASMLGDIAVANGKPVVHAHTVVGFPDGSTKAGHILEAFVWPTLEVMVSVEPRAMYKIRDLETGLSLIDPTLAEKKQK